MIINPKTSPICPDQYEFKTLSHTLTEAFAPRPLIIPLNLQKTLVHNYLKINIL